MTDPRPKSAPQPISGQPVSGQPVIDPRAIISPKAQLAADVTVGPFSIIGADVQIGPSTIKI